MSDTSHQTTSSNTVSFDTVQPTAAGDTGVVTVTGTTVVSVSDMPKESQPNGWLQLLLPIAITLLVVFVEKWVSRGFEQKDEKRARKKFRETVLDWIAIIQPIEKRFYQSIRDLSDEINASSDMQPIAYAMPLTVPDKLNELTVEKMTDAFLTDFEDDKDKRYEHLYNIISDLEFLSKISNGVKESYETYNKQSFALCQEWNDVYVAFVQRFDRLGKGNSYEAIVAKWRNELIANQNSVKVHLKYLDQLDTVALRIKDNDTLSIVNRMHLVAKQSEATRAGYVKVFSNIAGSIDYALKMLSRAEQYFRESESSRNKQHDLCQITFFKT